MNERRNGSPIHLTQATAPNGSPALTLRYGELILRNRLVDGSLRLCLRPEYEQFLVDATLAPHCELTWEAGLVEAPSTGPCVEADIWSVWRLADGTEQTVFYRDRERVPYMSITFDRTYTQGRVVREPTAIGTATGRLDASEYPLSEYVACRLLTRLGALELHASAAVVPEGALAFIGHSGAGKSTMARLAEGRGADILSDDRTIVASGGGEIFAWGTPWHGTGRQSSSLGAPLRAAFLLIKDTEDRLERLTSGRAAKELLVRLIQPRVDAAEIRASLDALEALVHRVPIYALRFRPTPAAFDLARSVVG